MKKEILLTTIIGIVLICGFASATISTCPILVCPTPTGIINITNQWYTTTYNGGVSNCLVNTGCNEHFFGYYIEQIGITDGSSPLLNLNGSLIDNNSFVATGQVNISNLTYSISSIYGWDIYFGYPYTTSCPCENYGGTCTATAGRFEFNFIDVDNPSNIVNVFARDIDVTCSGLCSDPNRMCHLTGNNFGETLNLQNINLTAGHRYSFQFIYFNKCAIKSWSDGAGPGLNCHYYDNFGVQLMPGAVLSMSSPVSSGLVKYESTGCQSFGTGVIFSIVSWMMCNLMTLFVIAFIATIAVGVWARLRGKD